MYPPAPIGGSTSSSAVEVSAKPAPKPAAPQPAAQSTPPTVAACTVEQFDDDGGIFTRDTRGCDDEVLVPTPATRAIAGPLSEDPLRLGHGEDGRFSVQVRDLSEGRALVSKPNGRKLAKLRNASADASAIATYLPAIRQAFTDAKVHGPILAEHITVVRGQFPAPHVALISVKLPNPDEEMDDYISALLLGDSTGAISGAIHEPAQRWEAFTIDYLVDLEADGVDEVGYTSAYFEGTYELLLEWDGAQPQDSTFAGDGA